jgi:hypothetical protein
MGKKTILVALLGYIDGSREHTTNSNAGAAGKEEYIYIRYKR